MSAVDERIVRMTFENGQFEKGAQTSISTLERLKNALNFGGSAKGLQDIERSANSINFNALSRSIETINNRFSTMGIAGMTVISNLTTAAMNCGRTLADAVIQPIASGGWTRASNIAQARFQIQGLGGDWEALKANILDAVNGTAYGFDEAAKVASQLTASGIEAGDTMKSYLTAISGVAAMTNSTYSDIGSIFTTVAGQGKLMTYQLNQLAFRGLNVAAELGKQLHKSEAEIRDMVTKGEISFDEFAKAMDNAYGKHAAEANKTFTGSLANMKAALARIGAEFATPFQDNMIKVYNAIRPLIDTINKSLNLGHIYDDFTDFAEKASNFVVNVLGSIDLTWINGFIEGIHSAYTEFDKFMSLINPFWKKTEEDAEELTEEVASVAEAADDATDSIEELAKAVIRGDYGNGQERIDKLADSYKRVQNKVNELLGCSFRYDVEVEETTEKTEELVEANEEAVESGEKVIVSTRRRVTALGHLTRALKYAGRYIAKTVMAADKASVVERVSNMFTGLTSVLDVLGNTAAAVIRGGIKPLTGIVKIVGNAFLDAGSSIGKTLTKFKDWMEESGAYTKIAKATNVVLTKFETILGGIGKVGRSAFASLKVGFSNAKENVVEFFEEFKKTDGYKKLQETVDKIKVKFEELKTKTLDSIKGWFEDFTNGKIKFPEFDASKFASSVSDKIIWLIEKIQKIKDSIKSFFETQANDENSIFNKIKTFFGDFSLSDTIDRFTERLKKAKNSVSEFFKNITTGGQLRFGNFIEQIKQFIASVKGTLGTGFEGGLESIGNFLSNFKIKLPGVGDVVGAITKLLLTLTGFNAIRALNGVFSSIWHISGILAGLKGMLPEAPTFSKFAESLLKVAGAIGIFAVSMTLFGSLSWDQFKIAAAAITVLTVAVAALMAVYANTVGKLGDGKSGGEQGLLERALGAIFGNLHEPVKKFLNNTGRGVLFASFGIAVALLAHSLKTLSKIPLKDALKGFGYLTALFLMLKTMTEVASKIGNGKDMAKAGSFLIKFGIALRLIASSLKVLSKIPLGDGIKGLGFLTALFIEMTMMMSVIGKLSPSGEIKSLGTFLVRFGLSLRLIASTLKTLSKIPLGDGIKALGFLTAVLIEMTLVAKAAGALTPDKNITKLGTFLLAFGISLRLIASSLKTLSDIPLTDGIKSVWFLSILMTELAGVCLVLSKMSSDTGISKASAFLVAFGISLRLIAGAVKTLSKINDHDLRKATSAITKIMAMLAGLTFATGKYSTQGAMASLKSVLPMLALLWSIAGALKLISSIDSATLAAAARAISRIMMALSLFSISASRLGIGDFKALAVQYAGMSALLFSIAGVFNMVKGLDSGQMNGASEAVSRILKALKSFMFGMSYMEMSLGKFKFKKASMKPLSSFINYLGMGGLLFEIAALFRWLNKSIKPEDASKMETISGSMASMMKALGVMAAGIGQLGGNGIGFSGTLASGGAQLLLGGGLFALVAAIVGVVGLIDEHFPDLRNFNKQHAAPLLESIGNAIGSFIGGIAGGVLGGIGHSLTDMGTDLITFLTSLNPLIEAINGIDTENGLSLDKLEYLRSMLTTLAEIGLAELVTNAINAINEAVFPNGLSGQITKLEGFVGDVKGLVDTIDANIGDDVDTVVQKISNLGSILDELGNVGIERFFASFKAWLGGGADAGAGSRAVAEGLVDETEDIAADSDSITKLMGKLSAFIEAFTTTLQPQLNTLDGLTAPVEKITLLKDIINRLGSTGWASFVAGIQAGFGEDNLGNVSDMFKRFSSFITDFQADLMPALDELKKLNAPVKKIELLKSVINTLGDTSWSTFVEGIKASFGDDNIGNITGLFEPFAQFIRDFSSTLQPELENLKQLDDPGGKLESLKSIINTLGDTGWSTFVNGIKAGFGNDNTTNFEEQFTHLGNFIDSFSKNVQPYLEKLEGLDDPGQKLINLKTIIDQLGDISVEELKTGLLDSLKEVVLSTNDQAWSGEWQGESLAGGKAWYEEPLEKLSAFIDAFADFETSHLSKLTDGEGIISKMETLQSVLGLLGDVTPKEGGLLQALLGEANLSDFGNNLENFGDGLSRFQEKVADVDLTDAITITGQLQEFSNNLSAINAEGGFLDPAFAQMNLERLGGYVSGLFANISDSITANSSILSDAGKSIYNYIMEGFNTADAGNDISMSGFVNSLSTMLTSMYTSANGVVLTKAEELKNNVIHGLAKMAVAIMNYRSVLNGAVSQAVSGMPDAARAYVGQFASVGEAMMAGLAQGIANGQSAAVNAAATAARNAVNAARNEAGVHSPSKVFMGIGSYMMEGLSIGINNSSSMAANASRQAAAMTIGSMSKAISDIEESSIAASYEILDSLRTVYGYINTVVTNAMDVDPKITPVMDLTNIQNGINSMRGMISGNGYTFGAAGLAYARSMYAPYGYSANQTNSTPSAISPTDIRGIRSDIADLAEAITGMQMVMDSGALVGSISNRMDGSLGSIQKMRERWA